MSNPDVTLDASSLPDPTDAGQTSRPPGDFTAEITAALRAQMDDANTASPASLFMHHDDTALPHVDEEPEIDGGGGASTATTPPPAEPPADEPVVEEPTPEQQQVAADLNEYARARYNRDLTPEEARAIFDMAALGQDIAALTPQQRLAIQQVMYGEAPVTTQPSAATGPGGVGTATPTPPDPSPLDALDPDDPYAQVISAATAPLQARLDALQADLAQRAATDQANARAAEESAINAAVQTWRADKADLTDPEFAAIEAAITANGGVLYHNFRAQLRDPSLAIRAALDFAHDTNPALMEREIARRVAAASPSTEDLARQARAASVAGGGGSAVPRDEIIPANAADRQSLLTQEIARAMDQANSGT